MNINNLLLEFERKLILQHYSINSIRNYKSAVKSFLENAETNVSYSNEGVIEGMVEKYLLWKVQKQKIGVSHQRMIITSIDNFFKLVYNTNLNIKHLYPSCKSSSLPNYLTIEEVKNMIAGVDNIKHKCIVKLLYGSGLRLSELLNLKVNDIDSKNMVIHISKSNSYKEREVMLSKALLQQLCIYFKKHNPVEFLLEGQAGGVYSAKSVQTVVKKAASKARIDKNVTPCTLRHSFAIHLLESGTDIRFIQQLLGHKSLKTTEIYTLITTASKLKIKSPLDSF